MTGNPGARYPERVGASGKQRSRVGGWQAMVVQRHRRTGGAWIAVAAVLGVVGTASGCGAEQPPAPDAGEAVRGAADALTRAGSARARTAMEMATGGTRVTIRGEGGVDFRNRLGQLLVMLPADVTGKAGHRPITELLAPGALYMKNRGAGVPADKWVRVDTASLADGNLVTGGATDPMAAAELLRGAQDVTYVGRPSSRGPRSGTTAGRRTSGGRRAVLLRTRGRRCWPRRKGSARTRCPSTSISTRPGCCGRSGTVSAMSTMA